ncbi:hypothetical protein C8R43DRAFT_966548 [Mycena crocata]|nr:hypothetical protein C8R43DRAFT_966548 [Mycena crocata]
MNSQQQPATSVSPSSRRTFSDRISAVGAKITRALNNDGSPSHSQGYNPETESVTSTIVEGGDRSSSRGREGVYHSSGRGGAGNFYTNPPPTVNLAEAQEFSWPRGRERAPAFQPPVAQVAPVTRSTGRGGSGNFSRSPPPADPSLSLRDREILRAHADAEKNAVRSSGRGGMGNIIGVGTDSSNRSRSRDQGSLPGYSPSPPRDRSGNGQVGGNGGGGYANGTGNGGYGT